MADLLNAAQRSKIRRLAAAHELEPSEEGGELNVVPFLDIIMNVLTFVLATVAITFTATIDVTVPGRRPPGPHPQVQKLDLAVLVIGEGFSLKASGGNVGPGCTGVGAGLAIPKRDGVYDFDALRTCAAKLKASVPTFADEQAITVSANPEIPYEAVIATMDAVRTSPEGDALFPQVALAVGR